MTAPADPSNKYLQAYPPDVQRQVARWLQVVTLRAFRACVVAAGMALSAASQA